MVRRLIKKILLYIHYRNNRRLFELYFKQIIKTNKIDNSYNSGLARKWSKRWGIFGMKPTLLGWKAFSSYMNDNLDFVPNEIARNFIEPILNPDEYKSFYNDKNSLDLIFDNGWLPKTYLRSMNGKLYDGNYESLRREDFTDLFVGVDSVVVKPSKENGGEGVKLFKRKGENLTDNEDNILSLSYLENSYKTNFLIQECLLQNEYMAQFNPTSINTLRIATYRDVKTGEINIIGALVRIGGKGSFVDNASAGGAFVSVDENGQLGKWVCNKYGQKSKKHNDIDFEKSEFIIPNWNSIKIFVINVAKRMPHMNLIANDIAIDINGNPRLVEVNSGKFCYWLYQLNGKVVFGKYTDDLLEYCKNEKDAITPAIYLKYSK